jgi:hypothetical protein
MAGESKESFESLLPQVVLSVWFVDYRFLSAAFRIHGSSFYSESLI